MMVNRLSHSLFTSTPLTGINHLALQPVLKKQKLGVRYISLWRPFSKPPTKSDYGQSDLELYSKTKPETSLVTRFWQGIKRVARIEEGDPDEQITEYFQYSVERLMLHPGEFTFEKFAMYLEDICTKLRIIGKRPISDNDLSAPLKQLKLQYEMMKYLSPREKESDSATVFSHQAKVLLAEAVKGTLKDVDDMLLHHDICKTDRTWYFRRIVLGRHLPTSYEEREHLSYQRPVVREASQLFPETQSLEAARLKKMRDDVHYRKIPTRTWPWYRHPTSGKNKWSTREYTKRRSNQRT